MIVDVALLGASCALNPVLLAIVLLTLASEHPKRMLGAYFAGAFTWSVGLGIGIVTVASDAEAFGGSSSQSRPVFDLVVGGLLLAGAFLKGTGRIDRFKARRAAAKPAPDPEGQSKPSLSERLLSGSAPLAFFAGVALNFPSVRYIAAMKEIVVAEVSKHEQVLAILLFNVLMLSPAIVPLALLSFRPEGTKNAIARLDAWMRANARVLLTGVLAALGSYLAIKGIVVLA
ncbi:MAG TPA: GAP family protein [Solirubrobacteraceae bacterium]|nr:GAP family protein [Solirubrobacteraceae bacterium]